MTSKCCDHELFKTFKMYYIGEKHPLNFLLNELPENINCKQIFTEVVSRPIQSESYVDWQNKGSPKPPVPVKPNILCGRGMFVDIV